MCFWNMIYQIFKGTTLSKGFYRQQKIFYKFDYNLHGNKYLKIGKKNSNKYYTSKQTEHKKPSNMSHDDLRHYFIQCVAEANRSVIAMGFKVWTFGDKRASVVKVVQDTP